MCILFPQKKEQLLRLPIASLICGMSLKISFLKNLLLQDQIISLRVDPYWEGWKKWKWQSCIGWMCTHSSLAFMKKKQKFDKNFLQKPLISDSDETSNGTTKWITKWCMPNIKIQINLGIISNRHVLKE